jgi:nucleoside-diphosphate-sugar epimerase
MLAAAERPLPTASIYDVVDDADLDQRELCREIRRSSEARIQPLMVPYAGVWSLMLGVDLLHLVRHGRLGTTRYRLKRTLAPMRFPCTAARRDLAWQPRVSLAEGLARIL